MISRRVDFFSGLSPKEQRESVSRRPYPPVLGTAMRHLGQHDEADLELERAEVVTRRLGMPRVLAAALEQRAHLAQPNDPDQALELHHAALSIRTEHGLRTFYADSFDGLAALALGYQPSRPRRKTGRRQ